MRNGNEMTNEEEYAVLDYGKLRFEHVFPPSIPGETLFEAVHRALCRLNGDTYFKDDYTGEYERIPASKHYMFFGTIPTITGGAVIPYIEDRFLERTGILHWKDVFARLKQYDSNLYELVKYQVNLKH